GAGNFVEDRGRDGQDAIGRDGPVGKRYVVVRGVQNGPRLRGEIAVTLFIRYEGDVGERGLADGRALITPEVKQAVVDHRPADAAAVLVALQRAPPRREKVARVQRVIAQVVEDGGMHRVGAAA